MSRLVIDVSGEQHEKLKTLANLYGKSIQEYIIDKILPEEDAWDELIAHLENRITSAEKNSPSEKSFEDLTREILQSQKS